MPKRRLIVPVIFFAAVMIWSTPTPAHAYLDAGSGSVMVQLLLAGTAGIVVLAKMFWQRLCNKIKELRHKISS